MSRGDLLLLTVNDHETKAILDAFADATGRPAKREQINDRVYHFLGTVNGIRVYQALSEMGSRGLGGAHQTVTKAITAIGPTAVIAVGIAFGTNQQKQKIGDILVSHQIRPYEPQRVGKTIVHRGDKPHASTRLINYFGQAQPTWKASPVRTGVLLTGDKLVDQTDFLQELKSLEDEAIGGDMEAEGVYSACYEFKVDWIIVKAICDWADGHKAEDKEARQQFAARNAADFVVHALKSAPLPPHAMQSASGRQPWYANLGIPAAVACTTALLIGVSLYLSAQLKEKGPETMERRLPFSQSEFPGKVHGAQKAAGPTWPAFCQQYAGCEIDKWTCKLQGELVLDEMDREQGMSGLKVVIEGTNDQISATCYLAGNKSSSLYRHLDTGTALMLLSGTLEQIKPDGSIRLIECIFDR